MSAAASVMRALSRPQIAIRQPSSSQRRGGGEPETATRPRDERDLTCDSQIHDTRLPSRVPDRLISWRRGNREEHQEEAGRSAAQLRADRRADRHQEAPPHGMGQLARILAVRLSAPSRCWRSSSSPLAAAATPTGSRPSCSPVCSDGSRSFSRSPAGRTTSKRSAVRVDRPRTCRIAPLVRRSWPAHRSGLPVPANVGEHDLDRCPARGVATRQVCRLCPKV